MSKGCAMGERGRAGGGHRGGRARAGAPASTHWASLLQVPETNRHNKKRGPFNGAERIERDHLCKLLSTAVNFKVSLGAVCIVILLLEKNTEEANV